VKLFPIRPIIFLTSSYVNIGNLLENFDNERTMNEFIFIYFWLNNERVYESKTLSYK
jgi:hypothetical protein